MPAAADDHPALRLLGRPQSDWWCLSFDGACEGNGRPDATGSWGFSLTCCLGLTIAEGSGPSLMKPTSSNRAEWEGAICGLLAASWQKTAIPGGLLIRGDSKLVLNCLDGTFRTKDLTMRACRDRARGILAGMKVRWACQWVGRERNAHCDRLAASVR